MTNYYCNPMGTVHGGAIASWVDIITSMAIFAFDKLTRTRTVTLDLSTDYMSAGQVGEDIVFVATVMKSTKKFAFTKCDCFAKSGRLMSTSTHKKVYINHDGKL